MQRDIRADRKQHGEDGQQRHAEEFDVGEIGESRRRLDLQAAAVAMSTDWMMKLAESVAMIGGILSAQIRR